MSYKELDSLLPFPALSCHCDGVLSICSLPAEPEPTRATCTAAALQAAGTVSPFVDRLILGMQMVCAGCQCRQKV